MNRRAFVRTASGMLVTPTFISQRALGCQEAVGFSSPDENSYAIWSMLIPILRPNAKGYLIPVVRATPDMTIELRFDPPLKPIERAQRGPMVEVDVPKEMQGRFNEAISDLKSRPGQIVGVERKFTLPHPYRLLDNEALAEYSRLTPPGCVVDLSHPWHRDRALERKFAGFSSPCIFSRVYYDQSGTLGLVWAGDVYAFRKEGTQWSRMNWRSNAPVVQC